jgi:hypothetical protein
VTSEATEAPAAGSFPQVEVPGVGVLSLAALDQVQETIRVEEAQASGVAWRLAELEAESEDRMAEAGAFLVPRRAWWRVPPALTPWLIEADRLVTSIATMEGRGQSGRQRDRTALRRILVMMAEAADEAAAAAVPDVAPLLGLARDLSAQAEEHRSAMAEWEARLGGLREEVRLRFEAQRQLGFDSLYLAAYFWLHGMPPIQSPIALETGEVAFLAVGAELARAAPGRRLTHARSAPGPPATQTGVRHWIGGLRHRPAPAQALQRLDSGTLVVTSHRLAFIGRAESVAVPLAGLVDVDVYVDAIAPLPLGRESPDFFLVRAPRQVAFYMNWALTVTMPS